MTDDELRCLVRNAIAQHLGGPHVAANHVRQGSGQEAGTLSGVNEGAQNVPPWRAHPSFGKFLVTSGADEAGPCLIEPTVACNHCGFCKSYGH